MKLFTNMTKPLVLFVLLFALGIGQMWGDPAEGTNWYNASGAQVYFDNTNSGYSNVAILIGRDYTYFHDNITEAIGSEALNFEKISGTNNLYYCSVSWSYYRTYCFIDAQRTEKDWIWGTQTVTARMGYAAHNTTTPNDNLGSSTHLYVPASDVDNCAVTHTTPASYDGLNYTQTVQQALTTDGGSTYAASTLSLATVKVSSYYLSAASTASATGDKVIAAGQSSNSCKAARTATVTYTVSDVAEGYDFLGWFDGNTKKSTSTTYDYQATEAKTITARFAPKFTTGKTLYLVTNSDWRSYSARFAAVFCNRTTQQWEDCSVVDGTSNEIYSVNVPEGDWSFVIFCRMKPGTENRWNTNEDTEDTKPVWCQTGDMVAYGYYNSVYITGNCSNNQRWGKYAPALAIVGDMNDWNPVTTNTFTDNVLVLNTLAAHRGYNFKIANGKDDTWYGFSNADNKLTYVGQTSAVELGSNDHNILLLTAGTGNYTFTWDASAHTLAVAYPEVTHPSVDYVYVKKFSDWDPVEVLLTGGTMSMVSGAGSNLNSFEFNKENYYYAAYGDNTTVVFGDGPNGPLEGHKTADLTISGNEGKFYDASGSYEDWKWLTFQVGVGLDGLTDDTPVSPNFFWVQLNSTDLSSGAVITTLPAKDHYDFQGFYTQYADGEVSGEQVIDKDGNWKASVPDYTDASKKWIHAGTSTTLYAKWTKHPYTITLAVSPSTPVDATDSLQGGTVQIGGVDKTSVNAYNDQESVELTAVPANPAYIFKEWRFSKTGGDYDVRVSDESVYTSTSNPIKIKASHDGTLTAIFQCRYGLIGSLKSSDDAGHGMPGWNYGAGDAVDFAVIGYTSLGEGADRVNLQCPRTLDPNTQYKFRILDRVKKNSVGGQTEGGVLPEEYNPPTYNNWQLNHMTGSGGYDVLINTKGRGTYTFHITNISDDGNYWPSIQVDRQLSYQVHIGWKHAEAENLSSLSTGNDGGTASVTVDEGAGSVSVANNDWVAAGSTISFTASPASSYYVAGWWSGDAYTGDPFIGPNNLTPSWTVDEAVNAFVKFVEKNNTFEGDVEGFTTKWNQVGNWSEGHIPTIDEVAIVPKPVEVDIADAKAKRVLIKKDSPNTGKIEIPAGKELIVAQTIKKTTDGSTYGATGYEDIVIGSSLAEGNGALVMNEHDGTNKATVYFATKAKTVEQDEVKHNVNQFIGTPFNDQGAILYNYYGTKIYRFMAAHDGNLGTENEWKRVQSNEGMNGFFGYNILTNQTTEAFLEMTGTLSRTNATETISGYYNGSSNTENMFANSWVAPIYIPNFKDTCFVNIEKTIYIFNAGTPKDQAGHAMGEGNAETEAAGQYSVLPANSSVYTGLMVIPSMQAFSVFATGENPKLKFDYNELVYNPSNGTAGIVPNRAPQRTNDADAPNVLRLATTGESGYAAKIVLLERTDFTDGYDDGWDGRFLAGDDAAPQLYAVTPDGNMAINSIPNIEGTLLGFKAGEADDLFTFSFDYDGEALYLYDTQLQTYTRVITGNTYAFTTTDNAAHNRFILTRNAPSVVTGLEDADNASQVSNKMIIDNHLYIFRGGVLYDAMGRIIK